MTAKPPPLRAAALAEGYGLMYAIRTSRAWWYGAWLRTLARFSRTYLGSFWLGLSTLLSVALLGVVYGTIFGISDPYDYFIYLGFGLTIWGLISQSVIAGCGLLTSRRDQLVNNTLPAIFYCLEEWAFQVQTFAQSFLVILIAAVILQPSLLLHALTCMWLPLLNLSLFIFWMIGFMAILGSRFKDFSQLMPILLQLVFLISPILYRKEGLGKVEYIAEYNIFYRILEPLRASIIQGSINIGSQFLVLIINLLLITLLAVCLRSLRYRLPLWV
jgi:lipopolysaccharide transport system permease protein